MHLHFVAPPVDAPGSPGDLWCGRAECRPPLVPSLVPRGPDSAARSGVRREGRRVGPQVEDGTCVLETAQRLPGLEREDSEI